MENEIPQETEAELKQRLRRERMRALLIGAGSIMDIAGATAPPRPWYDRRHRHYGFQQDAERLAGDWQRVGGYLRTAMGKSNDKG